MEDSEAVDIPVGVADNTEEVADNMEVGTVSSTLNENLIRNSFFSIIGGGGYGKGKKKLKISEIF